MDRRNEVEALFADALELDAEERVAFLDAVAARDLALHAEVASLLSAHQEAAGFFGRLSDKFVSPLFADLDAAPEQALMPDRVGPYRLVREVGRGGMSRVYLAERDDGQFEQQVAFKLVRGSIEAAILQRFEGERQILASLNHPHVARLFDSGVLADGRPYLVMEYVEGGPIDRYCDARHLALDERLRLFQIVLEAVQYAHSSLVVHRDLKPSNMLVTEEGQVKLLDFGIAKLLRPDDDPALTRTGSRWMTPEYAAPEQIKGEPITTATDIYQLGVLLYRLLTGHRPYRVSPTSSYEIERAVIEEQPTRPSTIVGQVEEIQQGEATVRVTPEAVSQTRNTDLRVLRRTLSGDLDAILLKALRKEPEHRYASAHAFSEDIQRYLDGRPVRARRGTWSYRAGKYIRRNTWGVAAAVVIAVLMLGYATTFFVQARQVAQERDLAQLEADKAEQVINLMINLFEITDPAKEAQRERITPHEFLAQGVRRIETDLHGQPAVQAEALNVIGQLYQRLGLFEEAETQLHAALAMGRSLPAFQEQQARSLMLLATVRKRLDDYYAADSLYQQALMLQRGAFGQEHPQIAQTLMLLATLRRDQGDSSADALYRQALAMQRTLLGDDHLDIAETLKSIALLKEYEGQFEVADSLYRQALAMYRRLVGNDHPEVAKTLNDLGLLQRDLGHLATAEQMLREALEIKTKVYGEDHPSMATAYYNLAAVVQDKGDLAAAEALYRQTLSIDRAVYGNTHSEVAADLTRLAALLHEKGDLDEADRMFGEALALRRATLPAGQTGLATALLWYGRLRIDQDRSREAEAMVEEALALRRDLFAEGHWRIAEVEGALGACYATQARFEEAEALLRQSYEALQANLGDTDRRTQHVLADLVRLYEAWGKPEQAQEYARLLPSV